MLAVSTVFNSFSQDTCSFESINLGPEQFYNGSSGTGGFSIGNANFSNYYNQAWSSWSGFAASSVTDNTTPGWTNDVSAFTGSGHNSSNYAVFYSTGELTFDAPGALLQSVRLTTSTFSALSMRDGDAFGKQFGSVNGADGNPDGTNGEDFFKIWIYAYDNENILLDSLDFYLADYRFSDNAQDYIVDEWVEVDLSQFAAQPVFKLTFGFESSDVGAWGINTPTYFAMDDLVYFKNVGIEENTKLDVQIYPNPTSDFVYVNGQEGKIIISDVNGKILFDQDHSMTSKFDISSLNNGIYFIELMTVEGTVKQKIIKN